MRDLILEVIGSRRTTHDAATEALRRSPYAAKYMEYRWDGTEPADMFHANAETWRAIQREVDKIEGARMQPVTTVPHIPRFTCRRCGEHRDTTIPGHCDDCEA